MDLRMRPAYTRRCGAEETYCCFAASCAARRCHDKAVSVQTLACWRRGFFSSISMLSVCSPQGFLRVLLPGSTLVLMWKQKIGSGAGVVWYDRHPPAGLCL